MMEMKKIKRGKKSVTDIMIHSLSSEPGKKVKFWSMEGMQSVSRFVNNKNETSPVAIEVLNKEGII